MLLAADSDRLDLAAAVADLFEAFSHGRFRGVDPGRRILADMSRRQPLDRAVVALGERNDVARGGVEHEAFRTFGTGIDSEAKHGETTSEVRRI